MDERTLFKQPSIVVPELRRGKEIADIMSELYPLLPERISRHLVESNIVLTFAGLKPETFTNVHTSLTAEGMDVEITNAAITANQLLEQSGTQFLDTPTLQTNKGWRATLFTQSLLGLERMSRLSHIPGVKPFDGKSGFDGFDQWHAETRKAIIQAQQDGTIPAHYSISTIMQGIFFGYPDQATYDFADVIANKKDVSKMSDSNIAFANTYQCAEPNFCFNPEHEDDPSIRTYIDEAGRILKEFYESPFHQRLLDDKAFLQAREELDKPTKKG